MNEPEMYFESKTQAPEAMKDLLGKDYDQLEVTVVTDQPEAPKPAEPAAAVPAVEPPPAPSPAPGSDAGAPPDGGTQDPPAEPVHPPEAKSKSGSAKLKERLEKERVENERVSAENKRLAAELEALKKAPPAKVEPPPSAPPAIAAAPEATNDPEPQEDQFNGDWGAFTKALSKWSAREALRERDKNERLAQERAAAERQTTEANDAKAQTQAVQAAETQRWNDLVEDAREDHPDYDDVMRTTAGQVVGAPALVTAVRDHEDGARLAYYLCTHLDEEKRIAELVKLPEKPTERQIRLAVIRANVELAKLKLDAPAARAAAPASASREARAPESGTQAPPPAAAAAAPVPPKKPTPPSTVGSRGTPSVRKLSQMTEEEIKNMELDEYRKRREAGEGS